MARFPAAPPTTRSLRGSHSEVESRAVLQRYWVHLTLRQRCARRHRQAHGSLPPPSSEARTPAVLCQATEAFLECLDDRLPYVSGWVAGSRSSIAPATGSLGSPLNTGVILSASLAPSTVASTPRSASTPASALRPASAALSGIAPESVGTSSSDPPRGKRTGMATQKSTLRQLGQTETGTSSNPPIANRRYLDSSQ